MALLREGLEALGDSEPRLALRMTFRLAYLLIFTDDDEIVRRARRAGREELDRRLDDAEARVLARFTELVAQIRPQPRPAARARPLVEAGSSSCCELAEECGREDLLFRVVQWSASVPLLRWRAIAECDRGDRARRRDRRSASAAPASPGRSTVTAAMRLLDRGEREGGEVLVRSARGGGAAPAPGHPHDRRAHWGWPAPHGSSTARRR